MGSGSMEPFQRFQVLTEDRQTVETVQSRHKKLHDHRAEATV